MVKGYSKVVNYYRPDLIANGLTCALDFRPQARIALDMSGNSNDGTFENHPRHTMTPYGHGLYFSDDARDPAVNLSGKTDLAMGTGNWSCSFFIKSVTGAGTKRIFDCAGGGFGLLLYHDLSTGALRIYLQDGPFVFAAGTTVVENDNLWHHVVFTVDRASATGMKIFLNGKEESYAVQDDITTKAGVNYQYMGGARIGRRATASGDAPASVLGGFSFWNRALTVQEIETLFNHFNTTINFKVNWDLTATNTNQETFVENLPARKNGAGTIKVTTDTYKGNSVKILTTAGAAAANAAIPWGYYAQNKSIAAYGEWRFIASSTTGACGVYLISDSNDASGSYYLLQVDGGNGQIKLIESGATATAITYTAGTWVDIQVIRRREGTAHNFYIYVNGVLATAASGSNPHNDSTITTSSYMIPYVSAANDKIIMSDITGKHSFYKK